MGYRHDAAWRTDEHVAGALGRYVNNQAEFIKQLEAGKLPRSAYPDRLALALHCPDCGELCFSIIWVGHHYLVHASTDRWIIHRCPDPIEDCQNND